MGVGVGFHLFTILQIGEIIYFMLRKKLTHGNNGSGEETVSSHYSRLGEVVESS